MSDLATDSIATVNGFWEAFNGVKARVLEACRTEEERTAMRTAFADVTTRAVQVKAHMQAMKACTVEKVLPTLAEVQRARITTPFPQHPVEPPPPDFFEGVNA